jgi:hypothetical protein
MAYAHEANVFAVLLCCCPAFVLPQAQVYAAGYVAALLWIPAGITAL